MIDQRNRDMLRHKRILLAVRLVFLVLVTSLALPDFVKGEISPVLPIILAAYFLTNVGMAFEKSHRFFSQRIQAFLILFDLVVLVIAMVFLDEYRQEIFLAMFLVMLLASAGQKLSVSIGGSIAVAGLYVGFAMQGKGGFVEAVQSLATVFPVLLVVAIYVGYVSETVARERRQRQEAEQRLDRELRGMDRLHSLASEGLLARDSDAFFASLAGTAADLLGTPYAAVFWKSRDESRFRHAFASGVPEDVSSRWTGDTGRLADVASAEKPVRISAPHPWLGEHGSALFAPFADRAGGASGLLALAWGPNHEPLRAEDGAAEGLARLASLVLENSSLYRLLSQTRDVWQSAFQSVPDPVVIVDGDARVVQANSAFLALGDFDPLTFVGSSFAEVLEGATTADGRPLDGGSTVRLTIPRLGGAFDVARGPYQGETRTGGGTVWVLRKIAEGVTAGGPRALDS
jgi:PAS domain-containing protein